MAIQQRRGNYTDFNPSKMLPAEPAIVLSGDPNTDDGKAAYVAFGVGDVKRLATEDDLSNLSDDITDVDATRASDKQELTTMIGNVNSSAVAALQKSNETATQLAEARTEIQRIEEELQDVAINPDDLGLYQDPDTYYVYPTYREVVSENGIPLAASGGGGGGGSTTDAVFTMTNTTGWLSKTISVGASCPVSFTWSSIENEMPTGNGTIRISIGDVVKTSYEIPQGEVSVDLANYIGLGTNKVKVRISDVYDQGKTVTFTITSVRLSIESTFDPTVTYDSLINFPFTPYGDIEKTVYFVLDGSTIGTLTTSASGRQVSYTIPAQAHGAHTLSVYFTAVLNNETVTSNTLYYEFASVVTGNVTPIVTSQYHTSSVQQFATLQIPYQVYNPSSITANVDIYVNNELESTLTVDRTEQFYVYRAVDDGNLKIKFQSGSAYKELTITVEESEMDVHAETEDLALFLTSYGKSNSKADRAVWVSDESTTEITATLSDFNFSSDGWLPDDEGITVLRCSGNARVTIPYKPFASDFRTTGKTIEIEFATRNVLNYDAVIMSCWSGDRGFKITAQQAMLKSEQKEISTQYKEDEHNRISFVVEKRAENRLIFVYINAIPSGVVEYPADDDFSQITPVNISIGADDCTIDIYNIRIYDNGLSRYQILDNWIADTQDGSLMYERYTRNNIYDQYGKIEISKLPSDLPYYILNAPELPQFKGDKKTISGSYVDPLHPSNSFTFTGCQINVQGTTSAAYARKNYDMQFKNGFEMTATGEHADNYTLRSGVIPFNRFVLKADVASSEGANNVELVRLYNDICPYKTPEMIQDSRVRWGIDGFPIVVFWNNTATGNVSFLGKYNFNLPKRAPAPYGYSGNLESWEFENNTADLLLFKSDYFDMTPYVNDDGDTVPTWRKNFEARFPSDAWLDIDILQEFVSFVVSTDREQATNNPLEQAVTYDGTLYTTDSSAYRLAKFKAEFPTYAELNTFIFYYIFTELFLMVDSRAKNLFIGFNGSDVTESGRQATRKATAQPYDMDTAVGTNNSGRLVFTYSLEDLDHLAGGGDIFNGQNSVLWNNVRDAYNPNITQMYESLRSAGLTYANVENRFEEHQSKWPEAVWIEDAIFKYIYPLTNPDAGKEPSSYYLEMLQGSKQQQRKWWLSNRFRYMDSKWVSGEALSQRIILRGYAKSNITITPYFDIYATVLFGSDLVQARATHGVSTTLVCPLDSLNDTEIYVYSAPQLSDVGDLSGFMIREADFTAATRLQSIKLGDSSSSYENVRLVILSVGNNKLLQTIDCRNCTALGTSDQKTVDLSGCDIIENIYFDGTAIKSVSLPNGGRVKVLSLPDTISNLTVLNQPSITTFSMEGTDYSQITTLRIENSSSAIPVMDILEDMNAGSRVRIIGFTMSVQSTQDVEDFYDYLDTMRGMDENGDETSMSMAVSGTITGLDTITGAWLAEMYARYPDVTITYNHISATIKFYNGSSLLQTKTIQDAGDATYTGTTPTKTADAQYTYTFSGWSKGVDDNTVDSDALTHVDADRNVYACFSQTLRTYTVYFYNRTTLLQTKTNVPYGGSATYTGTTPVNSEDASLGFIGWSPQPTNITGDTSCYAVFESADKDYEIVEPDLKYLVYTLDETNKTMTITNLNIANILADNLDVITIPDTIQGYHVIIG